MFKNNPSDIIEEDYSYLAALKMEIDKIKDEEEDYDEDKIFNNYPNFKINHCQKILNNLNELEDLLKEKIIELKDFDIKQNIRLESLIKEETEKLENLNFFNFPLLIDTYKKYLNDNLTDSEKKVYIISIFIEGYLKGKFYKE